MSISRANLNEALAAVHQAQKGADELEASYIKQVIDFKVGDQVILFKEELIDGEVKELIVAQVKIRDIDYQQFEPWESDGLQYKFERYHPGYSYASADSSTTAVEVINVEPRTEVVPIDFDRMQLSSEFLKEIEAMYEIPTAESVAADLEEIEKHHAEA